MPIYSYQCPNCNSKFDKFYRRFSIAKIYENETECPKCKQTAKRAVEVPLEAHLYGDPAGYHKPSPTKRHSTKLASVKGNAGSAG